MTDLAATVQAIAVYALPVLFAITLHEAAHGYVARLCGDATAYLQGRVSLNPLVHIDPVGTLALPIALAAAAALVGLPPLLLGYAKPLPVDERNLRDPRRSMVWIALAGPTANLLQAMAWLLLGGVLALFDVREVFVHEVVRAGVLVNLVMCAFNLIPLPPLDGGRALAGILPRRLAASYARIEPFGLPIVVALLCAHLVDPWTSGLLGAFQGLIRVVGPAI